MSDDIPFDIQIKVIKLLPIKSLIQFRSVSKPWKSVIESSDFIADYAVRSHDQPHHLLIRYKTNLSSENVYVLIEDNDTDTLLHNKFSITVVPPPVELLSYSLFVGTSHGLVCLMSPYRNLDGSRKETEVVVWNPSIRKSVVIAVPNDGTHSSAVGFGVCPATSEAKFVRITKRVTWKVEVYSLTWRVWRISPCNPPDTLVNFKYHKTQANGFIYWFGDTSDDSHVIISFDLLTEEFGEIHLPDTLAFHGTSELSLLNRSDSLVVIKRSIMNGKYEAWMMENGVSKSFTKLFTVNEPNELLNLPSFPLELRRNGEIMMFVDIDGNHARLVVYQPLSGHINDLGIKGINCSLFVKSYTESLLLLDQ